VNEINKIPLNRI